MAIRIETVPVKDLCGFIHRFQANSAGQVVTPISRQRACAQSHNPSAAADDIGLFLAYAGDQCIGYQGLLPALLRDGADLHKVYWFTGAFTLPEYRNRMVALRLIREVIARGADLALTNFTDLVLDLFKRLGFQEIGPLEYLMIHFGRMNLPSYPLRSLQSRFSHKGVRDALDGLIWLATRVWYHPVRAFFYWALSRRTERILRSATLKEVHCVEALPPTSEEEVIGHPQFERGVRELNWMLAHPWVRDDVSQSSPPYEFGDVVQLVRRMAVEIHRANDYRVLIVLAIEGSGGRTRLRVTDCHMTTEADIQLSWSAIVRYARRYDVDLMTLPIEFHAAATEMPFASILVRRHHRRYLCRPAHPTSPLGRLMDRIRLHYSDGDASFA